MSTEEIITMENRILEAAKQVFVRKGYEATKMGDVAAEAGIGRTALHYYYRTKEMVVRCDLRSADRALCFPTWERL